MFFIIKNISLGYNFDVLQKKIIYEIFYIRKRLEKKLRHT